MKCKYILPFIGVYTMFPRMIDLKKGNQHYKYLKVVESVRKKGKVVQKTLLNFGNVEQWPNERLKELIWKLDQFCDLHLGPDEEDIFWSVNDLFNEELSSPSKLQGFHDDERVIICYNPQRAQKSKQRRDEKLKEAQQYLQTIIDTPPKQGRRKKPEKVLSMVERHLRKKGMHKYVTYGFNKDGTFTYHIRTDVITQTEKTDGIWILLTNAQNLTPEEIALGYKTLYEVEHAFRDIKNFLRIRPIYHREDLRVKGHVFICVLAYLLEKLLEKRLQQAGLSITNQKALQKLKPVHMVTYDLMGKSVSKITKISKEQKEIISALGIKEIPKIPSFIKENLPKMNNVV